MELKNVNGHVEVYINNKFIFSADNRDEAVKELQVQINVK